MVKVSYEISFQNKIFHKWYSAFWVEIASFQFLNLKGAPCFNEQKCMPCNCLNMSCHMLKVKNYIYLLASIKGKYSYKSVQSTDENGN